MKAWELEKCIDEFGTEIYRFCMKLCMDKADAEDLYQQTFLKALESGMELDWEQNPKALFFSFAYNLWKSEQRKNARRSAIAPCVNLDETTEQSLRSAENIEENLSRQELVAETKKIIGSLPEKVRIPLTLYYLFDQPVDEIAKEIKKPPGTVKSRLFKGRSLIKKDWRNWDMENKNYENSLDELIRASMEVTDEPSCELNIRLKAELYQKEAAMAGKQMRSISLWYVPMVLNFILFSLFAVFALLVIANPYIAKLIAGICLYMSMAGVFITLLGVKRANLKEDVMVHIQKRGVLA